MSNFEGKDKIYEELKGYFPPEYDLTPDELEKEIELENKKREIAFGMIKPKAALSNTAEFSRLTNKAKNVKISASKKSRPATADSIKEPSPIASAAIASVLDTTADSDDIIEDLPTFGAEEFPTADVSSIAEEYEESLSNADAPAEAEVFAENTENDFENLFSKAEEVTFSSEQDIAEEDDEKDAILKELFLEMENTSDPEDDWDEGKEKTRRAVSSIFDFLEIFSVCITIIIVVFSFFARLTEVSGNSMMDTLHDNERLIVSNFMYEPKAGDIIVLQNTSLDSKTLSSPLVKRIIATSGETVKVTAEGIVSVTDKDGKEKILEQPYVYFRPGEQYRGAPMEVYVPEGYVFVMGDNRNYSADSRGELGLVDERCIFGKAIVRILPLDKFTVFNNPYED